MPGQRIVKAIYEPQEEMASDQEKVVSVGELADGRGGKRVTFMTEEKKHCLTHFR